ncbi:MAG: hypothetical protein ACO4CG_01115 [Prochlorothrix sp.]|nr:hypothetical protein [Prochlorothrix sp.]
MGFAVGVYRRDLPSVRIAAGTAGLSRSYAASYRSVAGIQGR